MYLSGYPCDDLLLRNDFMQNIAAGIAELAKMSRDGGPTIVGAPHNEGGKINSVLFLIMARNCSS